MYFTESACRTSNGILLTSLIQSSTCRYKVIFNYLAWVFHQAQLASILKTYIEGVRESNWKFRIMQAKRQCHIEVWYFQIVGDSPLQILGMSFIQTTWTRMLPHCLYELSIVFLNIVAMILHEYCTFFFFTYVSQFRTWKMCMKITQNPQDTLNISHICFYNSQSTIEQNLSKSPSYLNTRKLQWNMCTGPKYFINSSSTFTEVNI